MIDESEFLSGLKKLGLSFDAASLDLTPIQQKELFSALFAAPVLGGETRVSVCYIPQSTGLVHVFMHRSHDMFKFSNLLSNRGGK